MRQDNGIVSVQVDWLNEDSITIAALSKEYLEKNDYKLVSSFGGNNLGTFLYTKRSGGFKMKRLAEFINLLCVYTGIVCFILLKKTIYFIFCLHFA